MVTKEECERVANQFKMFNYETNYSYVGGTCYISVSKTHDDGYEEATLEISDNIARYDYTRDIFLEVIDSNRYRITPPGGLFVERRETTSFGISSVDLGEGKIGISINMKGRTRVRDFNLASVESFIPLVRKW